MTITVLTPDREIFRGNIDSVKVPGTSGEFQVKKNHASIVSSLDEGLVTLVAGEGGYSVYDETAREPVSRSEAGKKITFQIGGGFIEVLNNEISLLVRGVKGLK